MKHKELILLFFLAISIVSNMIMVTMCLYTQKKTEEKIIVEQKKEDRVIQSESKDYESYLREILTESELRQIGKKAWDIVISVNGEQFTSNTIYTKSESLKVLIGQVRNNTNIADSIARLGSLEDNEHKLIDYIHIYAEESYTVEFEEDDEGYKYYLKFDNLKDNTIISIELSQQIKARLHYADHIKDNSLSIVKR